MNINTNVIVFMFMTTEPKDIVQPKVQTLWPRFWFLGLLSAETEGDEKDRNAISNT
jgi:hypothetical protein